MRSHSSQRQTLDRVKAGGAGEARSPQEIAQVIEPVTQRPRARLDLLDQFVYLGEKASVEVAERYFMAVGETCAFLVTQPQSGTPY